MKLGFAAVAGAVVAAGLLASAVSAEDVIKARQDHMDRFGKLTKEIQTTLTSGSPDLQLVATNAGEIKDTAPKIPSWFPAGSTEGKTKALPVIWEKPEEFKQAAMHMDELAAKLQTTAEGGDAKATLAAFADLGKNGCGGCHGTFRSKEK
jgi:cytochrome c556